MQEVADALGTLGVSTGRPVSLLAGPGELGVRTRVGLDLAPEDEPDPIP